MAFRWDTERFAAMNDFGFLDFADLVVRYFTNRFGTVAGWIAAITVMLIIPALGVWCVIRWIG
jgi:hypothetical protein